MIRCFTRLIHQLHRNCEGALSIIFAVLLPVLIGFIALATDAGLWQVNARNMQTAADAAALAAGREIGNLNDAYMLALVKSESDRNGFGEDEGVTITMSTPPLTGSRAGNENAVEVNLSQPQERFFSVLSLSTDPVATARAVAVKSTSKKACVLALDETADQAVDFSGNPDVGLNGCVIAANSNSEEAININGNVTLSAQSLYTVGGYTTTGSSYTLNLEEEAVTHAPPLNDPYADLPDPSYGGCDYNNTRARNTTTLNPGVYCGDLTINANANVTLNPGTYYVHGGEFRINGNTTVVGNGVTIVLTGTGSSVATMDVNGSAHLDLTAPSSGQYEGMLIYQDRDASTSGVNKINGNSVNDLKGSIYVPNQSVEFSGNSSSSSSCLRLVSRLVTFSGNSGFAHDCDSVGGEDVVTPFYVSIVE